MQHFVCEVTPNPDAWPEGLPSNVAGAFVECWIDFRDLEGTEALCRHYLGSEWIIAGDVESTRVKKVDLTRKRDRKSWREAKRFGYSMTFNLWPNSSPNGAN
ncbi:hypothetical protein [Ottowia sp.]|uniref:hypothetical protein n=1 Tax=Ottowia sp. TaxID=1898956 RepID=UPI003A8565D3